MSDNMAGNVLVRQAKIEEKEDDFKHPTYKKIPN
jgi:hypothetical protein